MRGGRAETGLEQERLNPCRGVYQLDRLRARRQVGVIVVRGQIISRDGDFMIQVTASSNCTGCAEARLASKKAKAQRSSFSSFPQGKQIGLKTSQSVHIT
jgi:hypothetical protein